MFYLIEISTGDSKIAGKSIYEFETENEAEANFHSKLGSAMKSPLFATELLMVVDENGKVLQRKKHVAPVVEPTVDEVVSGEATE